MPWNFNSGSPMLNSGDFDLRIHIYEADVTKTLQLNPELPIYQLCDHIRRNIREAQTKSPKSFGLFLPHEDWKKGLWLDNSKTLQHYILRKGDTLEYRNRIRLQCIRTMTGVTKIIKVDDSWTVAELMLTVCSKLGIYNHEEYSLIQEEGGPVSPGVEKTLSMRRTPTSNKDQEKFDKLKKKYHTEDGLLWLNPSQTLRQQGIDEKEILLLKRKYFFSDMNVDGRDPVQLGLLYVQLKDAILNGTHPVKLNEAIELAGMQCQVQFGNYSAEKFKPGFLELSDFLPKDYLRNFKSVEKKIFIQHSKMNSLTEMEAKEKYCLFCRSLKTYGITFFLVKEKVVGKNKLLPRLLGVSKDSVVQVDDKSKDIINTWPLTSIKKWAASFNGFTMDFGEYSPDGYYTAQTDKGEKISQLIAGYIDIILKKKKANDHFGLDADEESVMYEENIAPSRAVIVEHVPKHNRPAISEEDIVMRKSARTTASSVRYSSQASDSWDVSDGSVLQEEMLSRQTSLARTQSPDSSIATNSQHIRMSDGDIKNKLYVMALQDNLKAIETYRDQLTVQENGMTLRKDEATQQWILTNVDNSLQRMTYELGAMNAAVAQVLRSAQGLTTIEEGEEDEVNEEAIARMQNSFSLIAVHLPSLIEEIKTTAYYQSQLTDEDDSTDIINAARQLADAFTSLVKAAFPLENQNRVLDKKAILDAANCVGEASTDLLQKISEQEASQEGFKAERPASVIFQIEQEEFYKEELLRLAKAVANATTNLIKQVKVVAVEAENPDEQKNVVTAATDTGLAISQLIATTKIVAPTIDQPVCQEQLIFSVEDVDKSIQVVVTYANKATQSDEIQDQTNAAAAEVKEALDNLMKHLKRDCDKKDRLDSFLTAYENIQDMNMSTIDPDNLIDAARKLAQATAAMIAEIKEKAISEESDDAAQKEKLISAARHLTEATTLLVDSARNCTAQPDEPSLRLILKEAAERFIIVTYTTECADIIQEQVIDHLLAAARKAATASTHLINTSQSAAKKSRASNFKVASDGQDLSKEIPNMIVAIKEARSNPKDPLAQLQLIATCKEFIEPSEQLAQSSKYMWPTVSDIALQSALNQSINQSVIATDELKKCIHQADLTCQHLDLYAALEQLKRIENNLAIAKRSIERETLYPLPDEKTEESTACLVRSVRQCSLTGNLLKKDLEERCLLHQDSGDDRYSNLSNLDIAGRKCRDLSAALDKLAHATRAIAASIELDRKDASGATRDLEKESQLKMIDTCLDAVQAAHRMVEEARITPTPDQMDRIQSESIDLSDALSRCFDSLPGQRDLEMLMAYVRNNKALFIENALPSLDSCDLAGEDEQAGLTNATFNFNQAVNELASSQPFSQVHKSCKKFRSSYTCLVYAGNNTIQNLQMENSIANRQPSIAKDELVHEVISIADDSLTMLDCAKKSNCEPENVELRRRLQESARLLLESVNRLLTLTSASIRPGQKECDKALMKIESMRPMLENPVFPVSHKDYYSCLDYIIERPMQPLAESLKTIPVRVKEKNIQQFIESIFQFADSTCLILEESAQAAYLVGIGDVTSKIGKKGLADHSMFTQIRNEIVSDCEILCRPDTNIREMISAATKIAENSKKLCDASKSVMITYPKDKEMVSEKTKSTLISVSDLMTAVQKYKSESYPANEAEVRRVSNLVQRNSAELVELLITYQFAGDSSLISEEAKEIQAPIKSAAITVLDAAVEVVVASKELISFEPEEKQFIAYSSSCKDLNDALKHLITTIKERAPGQKECSDSIKLVEKLLKHVYDYKMKIVAVRAKTVSWNSEIEESYQKALQNGLLQMPHCIDDLARSGKMEPEKLAHILSRLNQLLESITNGCVEAAKNTDMLQNSNIYLEHVATILEATEQFLKAVKTSGGNPKATNAHLQIDEMAQGVKESCEDLLGALDKISLRQASVTSLVETINRTTVQAQQAAPLMVNGTKYSNFHSKMLDICYDMNDITTEICDNASQEKPLDPLTSKLTQDYDELCRECSLIVSVISDNSKGRNLQNCVESVGKSSIDLVRSTSNIDAKVAASVTNLQNRAKELHLRIDEVIKILNECSFGTQASNDAIERLKAINIEIEKSKLRVINQNQIDSVNSVAEYNYTMEKMRKSVSLNSNSIVTNIKTIVTALSPEPKLFGETAKEIASNSELLSKDIISELERFDTFPSCDQTELLIALQDVIRSLISLLEKVRDCCELPLYDQDYSTLQENGKNCVDAITALLNTFKTVNQGKSRDLRSIDHAMEELGRNHITISNMITESTRATSPAESLGSANRLSVGSDLNISPRMTGEELNKLIPSLYNTTSRVLDTINPQVKYQPTEDDIAAISKLFVKGNNELTGICESIVRNPVNESKLKILETSKEITDSYVGLLKHFKQHLTNPSKTSQNDVVGSSRQICELLKLLSQLVESLKEGPRLVMYFRPSSPEWRDVSEKFIGRHVAYHHCYVKSYKSNSHTSIHSHSPVLMQIPINHENPCETDFSNAKQQVRYVTTKLIQIQPNKNLFGKDKYSVAEIDQMLTYIKDMGKSTESLLSSSQHLCQTKVDSQGDSHKDIFKSALNLANAMKELCEATNTALLSGRIKLEGIPEDNISTATRTLSDNVETLLDNVSPVDTSRSSRFHLVQNIGKDIKRNADLLLNHMTCIGGAGVSAVNSSGNSMNNEISNYETDGTMLLNNSNANDSPELFDNES